MACGSSTPRGQIRVVPFGLCHSHSNAGSESCLLPTPQLMAMPDPLTHWARPGMEHATWWFIVGFVSAEPRWELQNHIILLINFFFLSMATPVEYGSSWARGKIGATAEAYVTAMTTPDPSHVPATFTIACSSAKSLTHWARPGMEHASSWTQCWVLYCRVMKGTLLTLFSLLKYSWFRMLC